MNSDLINSELKMFPFLFSGINSILEAIWCGVPMIVMPFTMDQHSVRFIKKFQLMKKN